MADNVHCWSTVSIVLLLLLLLLLLLSTQQLSQNTPDHCRAL
jgi:hypothetical protein